MKIDRAISATFAIMGAINAYALHIPDESTILSSLDSSAHPRIFLSPERVTELRGLIQTDTRLASWYALAEARAEELIPMATKTYQISDNRLLSVSREITKRVLTLGLVYQISGDTRYADRAYAELAAAAAFPDWHPSHFLDVGEMMFAFAVGYDWIYPALSDAQRTTLYTALNSKGFTPYLAGEGTTDWWAKQNNWRFVCHGGAAVAALATAEKNMTRAQTITQKALTMITSSTGPIKDFLPDGAWYEGPEYWDYSTMFIYYAIIACDTALGTDFGMSDIPGLNVSGNFPVHITSPIGKTFNFADSGDNSSSAPWLLWMADRYSNPLFSWHEHRRVTPSDYTSWRSFPALDIVWYRPDNALPAATPLDMHFGGIADCATMRSRWNDASALYVTMKTGKASCPHSNLDIGTFILDGQGQRWAYDLGKEDYEVPGYWDYTTQRWTYYRMRAEAHNTLVINPTSAADQNISSTSSIIRFQEHADRAVTVANLTPAYSKNTTRLWRGISLFNNRSQVLVQDEITTKAAAEVYWFMTTRATITIGSNKKIAVLSQGGKYMQAQICSPSNAEFSVMNAVPLPTSPNPAGQTSNSGYRKLTIHMTGVGTTTLTVLFTPVATDSETVEPAQIVPLTQESWPLFSNTAPEASNQTVSVAKDAAKAITLGAVDPDGDELTYTIVTAPSHGELSGTPPLLTYTPSASYAGSDFFTFKVNDAQDDSNIATVSISQNRTVLIDYNDLNPTNGLHDVALLDGDFENITGLNAGTTSGESLFNQMPNWANLSGMTTTPQTEIASATNLSSGEGGERNAIVRGAKTIHGQSTDYTIQAGDSFHCSFQWRTALNSELDDVVVIHLFYSDDNALKTNNATLIHSFTAPNAPALNTWHSQSFTTPVVESGAVGKTLLISFTGTGSAENPIEFSRVDNVYLAVTSQYVPPAQPPEIGTVGIGLSGSDFIIQWNATNTATYVLQSRTNLLTGAWSNLVDGIEVINGLHAITNSITGKSTFYRVILQ